MPSAARLTGAAQVRALRRERDDRRFDPSGWRTSQTEPTGSLGYLTQASCCSSMIGKSRGTSDLQVASRASGWKSARLPLPSAQRVEQVAHARDGQDGADQAAQGDRAEAVRSRDDPVRASERPSPIGAVRSVAGSGRGGGVRGGDQASRASRTAARTRGRLSASGSGSIAPAAARWPPPPKRPASFEQSSPFARPDAQLDPAPLLLDEQQADLDPDDADGEVDEVLGVRRDRPGAVEVVAGAPSRRRSGRPGSVCRLARVSPIILSRPSVLRSKSRR